MKLRLTILALLVSVLMMSCVASSEILYFQDIVPTSESIQNQSYQTRIQPDDILMISVTSSDPVTVQPFNKIMPTVSQVTNLDRGYLVDVNGDIVFPILGQIKAAGFTNSQLSDTIKSRLITGQYVKDPSVDVSLLNFKFSVFGEVKSPQTFKSETSRITMLQALSMAGDLNIQANRDRIMVIREVDGKREVGFVDIRSKDLLTSPYYYLAQNDVIYVEPSKRRINQSADRQWLPIAFTGASVLLTVISLIF